MFFRTYHQGDTICKSSHDWRVSLPKLKLVTRCNRRQQRRNKNKPDPFRRMIYSLRAKMDAHCRPSEAGRAQNRNDHRFACIRHCRADVPKKDAIIGKKARSINPPRTRYLWRTYARWRRAAIPQEPSRSLLCASWSLSIMAAGIDVA